MLKFIQPSNLSAHVYFEDISCCPICNSKISPIYLSARQHSFNNSFSIYCECTSCGKPFIVYFKNLSKPTINGSPRYTAENIEYLAPIFPNVRTFDNKISSLSPNFVETYNQSLSAESYNLNQIAGMGYRKCLEYLIKDYCAYKTPSDSDKIYKMLLGQCINEYVSDIKIKNLSKVSVWIGNG